LALLSAEEQRAIEAAAHAGAVVEGAVVMMAVRRNKGPRCVVGGAQLPPVLRRPGGVRVGHVDADDRPVVAGAQPHRQPGALGIVTAAQFLPLLFLGPYTGVLADR
jgi:hypothetical protein